MAKWINAFQIFYPLNTVYWSTENSVDTIIGKFGGTWVQLGSQTVGNATVYAYQKTKHNDPITVADDYIEN